MHSATTPRSRRLPLCSPRPHLPHYENHAPFPRPRAPPMADCFALDVDDLHRRWLPREIFADIGIADAAPPSAAAVEDVAVHLTGILGGKEGPRRPPPPPRPASHHHQYHQAAQAGGLQGTVLVAYGGGCNGGGVPGPWSFFPYPPLQWQATTNFANGGGFPGAMHAPFHGPPPAKRRLGGTGVFLPRAQVYQYQHKAANRSPGKDRKPPKEMQQQQRGDEEVTESTQHQNPALFALPQEWTY
ncbi:unnamed protein product [Alopecurus aequalis]